MDLRFLIFPFLVFLGGTITTVCIQLAAMNALREGIGHLVSARDRKRRPRPEQPPGGGGGGGDDEEFEDGETLPPLLEQLGFPRLEWARFKRTLDTGMIEGAVQQVAPEYRDLVRRYFLLLASEEMMK